MRLSNITRVIVTGLLLTLFMSIIPSTHAATTTFSGRAFGVQAQANTPFLTTLTLADTGRLPTQGGEIDVTPISVQAQPADLLVLLSVTMGSDSQAESEAAIVDLTLLPGTAYQITADLVVSKSSATCAGVSGLSDIANLGVAGQQITVSGQPNQSVAIPGAGTLVINEQTTSSTGGTNSITVNALDLILDNGAGEVIVSSAQSGITCATPPAQAPKDFVTGGGFIFLGSGSKGTFGFVAGLKNGATSPSGNLVYHDHGTGLDAKATSVTSYCGSGNTRSFTGQAEVNGQSGYVYSVTVIDNGEPGTGNDHFSIQLASGSSARPCGFPLGEGTFYSASGTLGGGNIEIHN